MAALPQIGQIYLPQGNVPLGSLPSFWQQPGGIGTPVYPQPVDSAAGFLEPPLFPTGMYVFLCLHTFNLPSIYAQADPDTGELMAIICCPVCSIVQQIVPYSQFEDYIATPIVIA
jgi:hypothetical protein